MAVPTRNGFFTIRILPGLANQARLCPGYETRARRSGFRTTRVKVGGRSRHKESCTSPPQFLQQELRQKGAETDPRPSGLSVLTERRTTGHPGKWCSKRMLRPECGQPARGRLTAEPDHGPAISN